MSVLVTNFSEFFKVIIQAFNLSSTFPALIFVLLAQTFVLPHFPSGSPLRIDEITDSATRVSIATIGIFFFAYLLDAANLRIIRFFEGYPIKGWLFFRRLTNWNKHYVANVQKNIQDLRGSFDELETTINQTNDSGERDRLILLAEEILARLDQLTEASLSHPEEPDFALPSPLGNVIAAAERYPDKLFAMDAVTLWPFLTHILTEKNYAQFVVREKAVMDFLLNLTLVWGLLGGLTVIGAVWSGLNQLVIVKTGLWMMGSLFFFWLAVQAAGSWGSTIKAAFVVFREELRQSLHLRQILDYKDERKLWEACSNFLGAKGGPDEITEWGLAIFDHSNCAIPVTKKEKTQ